nr:PTS sugar transporter subunit IIA [Streptococcus pneumoniae]
MASILFSSEISIFNAYTQYILAAGYLNRVNDIWLENEENVENGLKKCSLEGRIDIKDLSFSYSKDSAPVIENLNLTIEPGQRIALVGQSGSGKSTLSKILSGLYKIDTGKILFDGVNINQIDKKILSQNLGVVPQDSTYREALITREKSFPTGLDMEFLGKDLPNVAIPHTDIVHNLAEKVVVVRLEKPVTFHNMIAPDKEVEVSLLFFIINNSSSSQTNILAQLMDFFTGNGHLEDLSKISEPEKLYAYIAEAIA